MIVYCLVWMLCFLGTVDACTTFILRGHDDSITLGCTKDFDFTFPTAFYVIPAGRELQGNLNNVSDSCKSKTSRWTSRYKMIIVGGLEEELRHCGIDGMNEHGLSVNLLYLRGTVYEDVCGSGCEKAISHEDVVTYILSNYRSVAELLDAFNANTFPCVGGNVYLGMVQPVHVAVTDAAGGAIVVEYIEGVRKVYKNTIRVVTNSPPYDWHMTNVNRFFHFESETKPKRKYQDAKGHEHVLPHVPASGLLGVPGDFSSPSRFVRAAALVHLSDIPRTSAEAILTSFHILSSVGMVKGTIEGRHFSTFTYYQLVTDLSKKCFYYRTYNNLSVRKLCLEDVANVYNFLPLGGVGETFKDSVKDVSNEIKSMKDEL